MVIQAGWQARPSHLASRLKSLCKIAVFPLTSRNQQDQTAGHQDRRIPDHEQDGKTGNDGASAPSTVASGARFGLWRLGIARVSRAFLLDKGSSILARSQVQHQDPKSTEHHKVNDSGLAAPASEVGNARIEKGENGPVTIDRLSGRSRHQPTAGSSTQPRPEPGISAVVALRQQQRNCITTAANRIALGRQPRQGIAAVGLKRALICRRETELGRPVFLQLAGLFDAV